MQNTIGKSTLSTNGQERNEVLNIMELLTKQKIFA